MQTRDRGTDRTPAAVQAQLAAMGCAHYELSIKGADGGMLPVSATSGGDRYAMTAEEVERKVSWLKRENAQGAHIYIRPAGSVGLVLADDLTPAALARMRADGLAPAAVTETSPGNHQAWVRLSDRPLLPQLATEAAKELAERYGGDPNAADWRHNGRLAGFTNRKEEHQRPDGRYPYVLLRDASGTTAPRAGALLERAQERFEARMQGERPEPAPRAVEGQQEAREASFSPAGGRVSGAELARVYGRELTRLQERHPTADPSRLDWMITKDLARAFPGATAADLGDALTQGSPDLPERKGRHVDDYVERTVRNVLADPQVAAVRARRGHEAPGRDERGHGDGGGVRGAGGATWAAQAMNNVVRSLTRDPHGAAGRGGEGRDERDPGARDGTDDYDR